MDTTTLWHSLALDSSPGDLTFNINYPQQTQSQSRELQHQENSNDLELYPALKPASMTPPPLMPTSSRELLQPIGQQAKRSVNQGALLPCPTCSKAFARLDSLKRHKREKHRERAESKPVVEHLCPHRDCKRSKKGSGFGRREHLQRHVGSFCKSVRRQQEEAGSGHPSSETGSVTTTSVAYTSIDHEPSTLADDAAKQLRGTAATSGSGDADVGSSPQPHRGLLVALKKQTADERLTLDAEKKTRRKRKDQLQRLEAFIAELEEK